MVLSKLNLNLFVAYLQVLETTFFRVQLQNMQTHDSAQHKVYKNTLHTDQTIPLKAFLTDSTILHGLLCTGHSLIYELASVSLRHRGAPRQDRKTTALFPKERLCAFLSMSASAVGSLENTRPRKIPVNAQHCFHPRSGVRSHNIHCAVNAFSLFCQ